MYIIDLSSHYLGCERWVGEYDYVVNKVEKTRKFASQPDVYKYMKRKFPHHINFRMVEFTGKELRW